MSSKYLAFQRYGLGATLARAGGLTIAERSAGTQSLLRFHELSISGSILYHGKLARTLKLWNCLNTTPQSRGKRCVTTSRDVAKPRRPLIPSAEQEAIIEVSRTQNVVVSARPGAGKTATAEAIVAANPNRRIAVITYSKRLQLATARRLVDYPACVYTFHGMAGRLFSSLVSNDSILHSFRKAGDTPIWTGEPYDVVILDELQDCTDDLFWLTCAFISAVTHAAGGRAPQIVCLGDERQAIYDFKGADSRFLSLAPSTLATLSPHPWTHLPLSKSFRLSYQNSAFVNKAFLGGEEYIKGSHDGPKPLYMHGDTFKVETLARTLVPMIRKYGPEQTAIIAPFVRGNGALSKLTNYLSEQHMLPVAVSISDEVTLDDAVICGKICVSTYHQFKGNERDLVIVYGVDASYFKFLAPDLPDDTCPNVTFVALTRACKQLVVLHHDGSPPMPFIDTQQLHLTADFLDFSVAEMVEPQAVGRPITLGLVLPKNVSASLMARHVPNEILDEICKMHLKIKILTAPLPESHHIDAPDKVLTNPAKQHYEAVSDLNGMAVVAAYELSLLGTLTTLGFRPNEPLPKIPSGTEAQAAWLCHEACDYEARVSGYKSRKVQMNEHAFDWLGSYLDVARDRLRDQFLDAGMLQFEVRMKVKEFRVEEPSTGISDPTCIQGRADIVRYDDAGPGTTETKAATALKKKRRKRGGDKSVSIWEIKFVAKLSLEHAIQAVVYAYLWFVGQKGDDLPRIILFNVKDGEKWEITSYNGVIGLRSVVEEVLRAKYTKRGVLSTDEFLKKCVKTTAEVERYWENIA